MKVDIETVDAVGRKLHIALPADDLRQELDRRLADLRKAIQLPGFRPNRVPISIVRSRYGKQVENETIWSAAVKAVEEAIERHQLKVVSEFSFEPDPEEMSLPAEGDLRFTAKVEVRPPIHIPPYNTFAIDKSPVNVTPEEVEEELESIRRSWSEFKPIEEERPAQKGDSVLLILDNLEEDQTSEAQEVWAELDDSAPPELLEAAVGMNIGSHKLINLRDKDGNEIRHYVELKQIAKREDAELDDAMAQKIGYQTLDILRGQVWNRMIEQREQEQKSDQTDELFDQLLERIECSVPDLLIDRALQNMRSHDLPVRADDEARRQVERMIRREWILDEIAEKEGIELSEEEAAARARNEARRRQEDPDQYIKALRESDDWDSYVNVVQFERIVDLLIERASQKGIITP